MRVLLVVLAVAGALGAPQPKYIDDYYKIAGIPTAARIKAAETAVGLDGSRLVGGSPAYFGDFPSMAGLIINLTYNQMYEEIISCGATLLSNTKLVTAAHCWRLGPWEGYVLTVALGTPYLFIGGRRFLTNKVELHPQYDQFTLNNDIAMITIDPVEFNANISPARLPTASNSFLYNIAQATGYGVEGRLGFITPYQLLRSASVQVVSNDVCQEELGHIYHVSNATICTSGAGPTGLCFNDGGSPLLIDDVVIGIGSFFQPLFCDDGTPSGYTRVSSYLDWITERL